MTTHRLQGVLLAALLTTSLPLLLVGCASKSTPAAATVAPDTTPPTVTITGTSTTAITAPVTVGFTFSEDVGTSFTLSSITVTNGEAAPTLVKVDAKHYTLIVTPPAASTGTLQISVAAASFSDLAGNKNAAAVNATQTFNTVVSPVAYSVLDFNTAGLTYKMTDFGGTTSTFPAVGAPTGGPATPVVKILKNAGAELWAGTTLSVGYLDSIGSVPFSAVHKKLTAVVYSPVAGASFKLKLEDVANGAHSVETDATAALGWQTLTFDMGSPSANTPALDLSWTYNRITIFPNFWTPSANEVYYVGPIMFLGTSMPSAPPLALSAPSSLPAAPTLASSKVISLLNSSATYTNIAVGDWNPYWGQGGSIADVVVASKTIKLMNLVNYQGVNVSPTGSATGAIDITGKSTLHISYWTADGTNLQVFPINGATEYSIDAGAITKGAWTDLEIPITQAGFDLTTIRQLKFVTTAAGHFYLDNVYFHAPTAPTSLAPAPSLPAASVISLLSGGGTYSNIAVSDWNPNWGQSSSITDYAVGSATIKKLNLVNYQGIQISSGGIDITGKNHLHISYWTPDGVSFNLSPIIPGPIEYPIPSGTLTQGAWTDLEITINKAGFSLTNIFQLKFDGSPSPAVIYLDNIYFH